MMRSKLNSFYCGIRTIVLLYSVRRNKEVFRTLHHFEECASLHRWLAVASSYGAPCPSPFLLSNKAISVEETYSEGHQYRSNLMIESMHELQTLCILLQSCWIQCIHVLQWNRKLKISRTFHVHRKRRHVYVLMEETDNRAPFFPRRRV